MSGKVEDLVEEYVSLKRNPKTRKLVRVRLKKFFDYSSYSPEEVIKLSSKEAKREILKFQASLVDKQKKEGKPKNNSILTYISAIRSFLKSNEVYIEFENGELVRAEEATTFHVFENDDLGKLFQVASTRYKAILATGTSLGWSVNDVLGLDEKMIIGLMERAKENNEKFIFFRSVRKKTNVKALGILNPLAIEWITKWLKLKEKKGKKNKSLFGVGDHTVNYMLNQLAKEANIKNSKSLRFHGIRGWVISKLATSGFNEFEVKYIVGKQVALSDRTYINLNTLEESIRKKFPEKYYKYLSISHNETVKVDLIGKEKELKSLKAKLEALDNKLRRWIEDSKTDEHLSNQIGYLNDRIGNLEAIAIDQQKTILQLKKQNEKLKLRKKEEVKVVLPEEETEQH